MGAEACKEAAAVSGGDDVSVQGEEPSACGWVYRVSQHYLKDWMWG